jgi:adenylylsulfate kinase-like enzyme
VDDPYEEPTDAEIVVDAEGQSAEDSARYVIERLDELGAVSGARVEAGA